MPGRNRRGAQSTGSRSGSGFGNCYGHGHGQATDVGFRYGQWATGAGRHGAGQGRAGQGGGGRGGGNKPGSGPGGDCICPSCGHKEPHVVGQRCVDRVCPKCGTRMVRE